MPFSPIFNHRATVGDPIETISPAFLHRATAGLGSNNSPAFLHRAVAGQSNSFSAEFLHVVEFDAVGRIRGAQLESPLPIQRGIDVLEGDETTAPAGYVRLFAKDGNLRYVNPAGRNVNLGLLGVPLGGVIPWYPPDDATEPPESFEYADGSLVSTEGSPFLGQVKPALMSSPDSPGQSRRFARGADASAGIENIRAPNGLVYGGADSHFHDGVTSIEAGHTHDPGSLRLPIDNDLANIGGAIYGGDGAILISDAPSPDVEQVHTHAQNTHDHGGFTSATTNLSAGQTGEGGSHSHITTTDSQSNLPAYVELAWIMRVI